MASDIAQRCREANWLERGKWVNLVTHPRHPQEARSHMGRILSVDAYGVAIRYARIIGSGADIVSTYIPWGEITQIDEISPLPNGDELYWMV